jgi:hypothetical protein
MIYFDSLPEFFVVAGQARHDNALVWALRFQPPSLVIASAARQSPVYYKDCHPGEGQDLLIYKREVSPYDAKIRFCKINDSIFLQKL